MLYTLDFFEQSVRTALNANCHGQPLLDDMTQLRLSEVIRHCAERAAEATVLNAEPHRLERGHTFGDSLRWQPGENWGYVPLPVDFLRLCAFEMSDWRMPVTETITPASDQYLLQRLPYPGLGGNPQMPVCAVVNRPEGLVLEFYSCASQEATVTQAFYAPKPKIADACAALVKKIIANTSNTTQL